jgi:hypothetical protein
MQGFVEGRPVLAKVSWAANEVPLLNGEAEQYGLRAETAAANGTVTRWFVPWSQISYLKQDIPVVVIAEPAVQPAPVGAPKVVPDPPG